MCYPSSTVMLSLSSSGTQTLSGHWAHLEKRQASSTRGFVSDLKNLKNHRPRKMQASFPFSDQAPRFPLRIKTTSVKSRLKTGIHASFAINLCRSPHRPCAVVKLCANCAFRRGKRPPTPAPNAAKPPSPPLLTPDWRGRYSTCVSTVRTTSTAVNGKGN